MKKWLQAKLQCHHKHGFKYVESGGKCCPYSQCECEGGCSIPVYEVFCPDCKRSWTLGEDALIDFFATKEAQQ